MKTNNILALVVLLLFINISFSQTLVNSFQKISATEGLFTGTLNDNDFFGRASTCIGDLDGDGVNDVAIGAPNDDDGGTNKGAVWILFLNSDGTVKSHQKISDTQGGLTVSLGAGGVFGSDVDTVGDLNGDGVVDLAIGAQYDNDGGNWHGAIWILFMNPDGTVNNQQKISNTQGGFTANFGATCTFGSGIDPIGDFNGDNIPDLVVGMRRDNDGGTRRGAVFIICLNQNGTVNSYHKISDTQGNFTGTLNNEDFFGCSVASLGDLDGDTIVDIAVGAFGDDDGGSDHGCVWILFLNANGQVKSHQKISSTQGGISGLLDNNDRFAHAMNPLGDFDDDGVNDLIVGAINDDDGGLNRGAAYLIYLNQNGTVKDLDKISNTQGGFNSILDDDDIFGQSVANIGDFNGGGTDDLIVGAALDDDGGLNKGAVYILFMDSTIVSDSGNALDFDGINDYVDLGPSAGNGVRTIELWFRPENDINNSITDYAALVARNNDLSNEHEITLAFTPSMSDKGKLVFGIKNSMGNLYQVISNSDSWNAGQWYHVAAVIHPTQGMMLFVDGVKQIST
ncbi:MAG: hypothetical protein K8S00_12975, partial [Bacteroidales bacterium]|nr:hypothetical protein [Bacteroidales bacterium]